jgi:hypothetical protein
MNDAGGGTKGGTVRPPQSCAFCGEDRLVEIWGPVLLCNVCARLTPLQTTPSPRDDAPGRAIGERARGQDDPR